MKNFSIRNDKAGSIRCLEINFIFFKRLIQVVCMKIGKTYNLSFTFDIT